MHSGDLVLRGNGTAAMGDPLRAASWLAKQLAARGREIEAGHLVITGGLTASVPLHVGEKITATFANQWTVAVSRDIS